MADVVLNFIAKGDELKPAEDALDRIESKCGEAGAAWKQTAEKMAADTKPAETKIEKLAQSILDFAATTKSLDKVTIGAAFKTYADKIQAALGLTNKELIAYLKNVRQTAQANIFHAGTDQEAEELTTFIEVLNAALGELESQEREAGESTKSFAKEISEAKLKLKELVDQGKEGSPEFLRLRQYIAETTDKAATFNKEFKRLGSGTKELEGLISLAGGVAGAFGVAQGAMALFGSQDEQTEKALVKLNAAMAILQGLTQFQQVLAKDSSANLLLTTLLRKKDTAAIAENTVAQTVNNAETGVAIVETEALAGAETAQIAATEGATVAQEGLNAAMLANPAGIVIGAILALVAAYSLLSGPSKEQLETQLAINEANKEAGEYLQAYLDGINHVYAKEIELARNRGASIIELTQLEGEAGNKRLQQIKATRDAAAKQYNELQAFDEESAKGKEELGQKILDLDKQYSEERKALELKALQFKKLVNDEELKSFIALQDAKVAAQIAGSDAQRNEEIKAIKAIAAEREKSADFIALTDGEKAKQRAEDAAKIRALELQNYQHYLKGRTSATEASIAELQTKLQQEETDSLETIKKISDLTIKSIRDRAKEELADPTLNTQERRRIRADRDKQIAAEEAALQLKLLNIRKAAINAGLELAKEGTLNEYQLKLESIENERKIALQAAELTQQQIDEINAKAEKKRRQANSDYLTALFEQGIAYNNAALLQWDITEQKKLEITLARIEKERAVELLATKGNAAKAAEVNAKYDKQKHDARLAALDAELQKELRNFDVINERRLNVLRRQQESPDTTAKQKQEAVEKEKKLELDRLALEFESLEKRKALITDYETQYEALVNRRVAVEQSASDKIVAIKTAEIDRLSAKMQEFIGFALAGYREVLGDGAFTEIIGNLGNLGTKLFQVFGVLKAKVKEYNDIIENQDASDEERAAARLAKFQAQKEAFIEAGKAALTAIQDISNKLFAEQAQKRAEQLQADLQALEEQKQRELSVKNLTEQNKADIEQRYADKEKQLKRRAFEEDKRMKRSQALINAALAATLAFANYAWPYNLVVAGITAALAAIEIDQINSASPGFKKGVIDIQGPGTETSDDIPVKVSRRESIMTAEETKDWKGAFLAIRNKRFPEYMKAYVDMNFPDRNSVDAIKIINQTGPGLDINLLAEMIGEQLSKLPAPEYIVNNIDSEGLHQFVRRGDSITEFKNRRYESTN